MKQIAIHGLPRSGTTWLGEILNSSSHTIYKFQPLFSYRFKGYLTPSSSEREIDRFFQLLAKTEDPFLDQTEKRGAGILPSFEKTNLTHTVYKEVRYHNILHNLVRQTSEVKVVALIRSPLSVINSWLRAPREFRADLGWDPLQEWRYALKKNLNNPEEFNGFEKWKEGVRVFLTIKQLHPRKVHLIEYRNLITRTSEEIGALFEFCQLPVEQQTLDFVKRSTSTAHDDPYAVFRENQDDSMWTNQLPKRIAEEIIADLRGSDLERFLYL